MVRDYKVQKEEIKQTSKEIDFVSFLEKGDKDALIKKSQLDKRFIKTSLNIKRASSMAQSTPKFNTAISPQKAILKGINEQNALSLRAKFRPESETQGNKIVSEDKKVLRAILSQGT